MVGFLNKIVLNVNSGDSLSRTPLIRAFQGHQFKVALFLIRQGAEINCISKEDGTTLTAACSACSNYPVDSEKKEAAKQAVRLLLEKGAESG